MSSQAAALPGASRLASSALGVPWSCTYRLCRAAWPFSSDHIFAAAANSQGPASGPHAAYRPAPIASVLRSAPVPVGGGLRPGPAVRTAREPRLQAWTTRQFSRPCRPRPRRICLSPPRPGCSRTTGRANPRRGVLTSSLFCPWPRNHSLRFLVSRNCAHAAAQSLPFVFRTPLSNPVSVQTHAVRLALRSAGRVRTKTPGMQPVAPACHGLPREPRTQPPHAFASLPSTPPRTPPQLGQT